MAIRNNPDILIIGHGEMGQAFEYLLGADNVDVWHRHTGTALEQLVHNKKFVFFCIPASPVHSVAQQIKSGLSSGAVCLSIAKGLDDAGRPAALAMKEALGDHCVQGVIYGPMISEELRAGRPGFGNLALTDDQALPGVLQLFAGSTLRLQPNSDWRGSTWCAILKNVYALAFGMADELGLGDNMRGYLTVTSMQELSQLSTALGGEAQTPFGLAGLGDLITTATSEDSHHHSLGRQLARGDRDRLAGEGIHTLQIVREQKILPIDD